MKPVFTSIRVFAITGALVMTTTMAASPVRSTLWPLASRQLARFTGEMPSGGSSPGVSATTGGTSAIQPRSADAALDAAYRPAAAMAATSAGHATSAYKTRAAETPPAGTLAPLPSRTLDHWLSARANGDGRYSSGRWAAPGSGAGGGLGSIAGMDGRAPIRAPQRGTAGITRGPGGRGPGVPGPANRPPAAGGASAGRAPAAPPAASAVFNEHQRPMPALVAGGGGGGTGFGTLTPTSVSSTPEPGTWLLLATGMAAAARSLRRRFVEPR